MKVKMNATLAIRIAILTVAMVGTFIGASTQPVPVALDGGPILVCPPKTQTCQINLPPMS